jgi:hypothetical protein
MKIVGGAEDITGQFCNGVFDGGDDNYIFGGDDNDIFGGDDADINEFFGGDEYIHQIVVIGAEDHLTALFDDVSVRRPSIDYVEQEYIGSDDAVVRLCDTSDEISDSCPCIGQPEVRDCNAKLSMVGGNFDLTPIFVC